MIGNLLLAGVFSLAQPQLVEAPLTHQFVKQVICNHARGTAVKIGPHRYVSVDHVTKHDGCTINGQPIFVTYADHEGDFSIVSIYDPEPGGAEINCDGFQAGNIYRSIGFARGERQSVAIDVRATDFPNIPGVMRGWRMFVGVEHFIPGMSGGGAFDQLDRLTGMVNAYNGVFGLSWSRPLSETVLCRG